MQTTLTQETVLTDSNYSKLLADLRRLIGEGKRRAQQAVAQELVATHWHLGKRIAQEELSEQAGYTESILEDLAEDLNTTLSNLRLSLYFFRRYLDHVPRETHLTWSHYKALIPIQSDDARDFYQKRAVQESWSRETLRKAIAENLYAQTRSKRGSSLLKIKRPLNATYVYAALVERVVDGDTLLLRIDLGFQVWKEQRVRLAQIDAAAIDSKQGRAAFEYVRDQLAQAPYVVIKTNKIDIYGRYVADVFYSFTEKKSEKVFLEGRHLNQELLTRGLAKRI